MHLTSKLAAAAAATLAAVALLAAPAAQASAIYQPTGGYMFASNTGGTGLAGSGDSWWKQSTAPLSYQQSSQAAGATSAGPGVNLTIAPDSTPPYNGYADSGVIVPLGTIASSGLLKDDGSLALPAVTGSPGLQVNIYFDTNGDGTYFSFNSDGVYEGTAGDGYAQSGGQPIPAATVTADENSTEGTATAIWAWVGICCQQGDATTGTVSSVGGKTLAVQVPAVNPVTGLKATAKYTNLTASWKASTGATSYKVTVTTHQGATTVAKATVTGLSHTFGHLKEKTGYAVHVLAEPATATAKPATVDVTTK